MPYSWKEEKRMDIDLSKLNQDADSSFLDKMSKEEREAWIAQETESAEGWAEEQNKYNMMTEEERKIYNEELDYFMFRHGLGKYIYG